MAKIKLYDYQQKMLADIIAVFSGLSHEVFYGSRKQRERVGKSVMVQMPTGTGKTVVMAAVVKWFCETLEGMCGSSPTGRNWWNRLSKL